jgi:RNA polymerase sigma factor (sigma-70 family)
VSDEPLRAAVRSLRGLAAPAWGAGFSDGQLLEGFVTRRDQDAFAALVRRHGPLVWGLCRRILSRAEDAEDAFQATFLVLARRAGSIAKRESVGSWLHGVAHRVAVRAKRAEARRRTAERQRPVAPPPDALQEVVWRDLRRTLDEEVLRLPARCRVPFVLCYLEGKTNEEAACLLGCPKGTVLSRLAHARELLRARLARRGLVLSAGLLATMLPLNAAPAAVPAALIAATARTAATAGAGPSAAGIVSAHAAALMEGVLRTMFLTKVKNTAVLLLTLAVVGTGAGMLRHVLQAGETAYPVAPPPAERPGAGKGPAQAAHDPARTERLIKQLGSPKPAEREAAEETLKALGRPILKALRKAAEGSDDAEVRRGAARAIEAIEDKLVADARKALLGTWQMSEAHDADPDRQKECAILELSAKLYFINEVGEITPGSVGLQQDDLEVTAADWDGLKGRIVTDKDGTRILWANQTKWTKKKPDR